MSVGKVFIAAITASITLASCTSRGDFSRFADIGPQGWAYGDTLVFEASRPDSLSRGTLEVSVRHNNDYGFANIWLEIGYNDSGHRLTDTVNLRLADVYGRWTGSGFGATRQAVATIATGISPLQGKRLTVRHIMRLDTLKGIESVGLTFKSR